MEKYEEDFERLWLENKKRLLNDDPEYRDAIATYDMSSGADWLLFGIPVAAGIVSAEYLPIYNEILKWTVSVLITVIVFAICVWVKSLSNPHRAIEDIEADVKKKCHDRYLKTGKI